MTSKKRHKSPKRTEPANGPVCPSCGLATLFESRFCHSCGATLDGGPGGSKWFARNEKTIAIETTVGNYSLSLAKQVGQDAGVFNLYHRPSILLRAD